VGRRSGVKRFGMNSIHKKSPINPVGVDQASIPGAFEARMWTRLKDLSPACRLF
jgi:hypothetical protein